MFTQDVLQDRKTEKKVKTIIEIVQAIQEDETDHCMEEKEPVEQNMNRIYVDEGRK